MTLTVAIAYEVRKMLSRESIYTYKLVRRGHRIPDVMKANVDFSYRAADFMNTHIFIVPSASTPDELRDKAASQPEVEFFLLEEKGSIIGISLRGGNTVKEFCTIPEDFEVLDSLQQMHRGGASIALVSSDGSLVSSHARGIVTKVKLEDMLAESVERYGVK
jgi:CIC family chloride channel protein